MSLLLSAPTARGAAIATKIRQSIALAGTSYTYRRAGSAVVVRGRLVVAASSVYAPLFTKAQTDLFARPIFSLTLGGDFTLPTGSPVVGDAVDIPTWNRSSLSASELVSVPVRAVFYDTIGDAIVRVRLFLAADA